MLSRSKAKTFPRATISGHYRELHSFLASASEGLHLPCLAGRRQWVKKASSISSCGTVTLGVGVSLMADSADRWRHRRQIPPSCLPPLTHTHTHISFHFCGWDTEDMMHMSPRHYFCIHRIDNFTELVSTSGLRGVPSLYTVLGDLKSIGFVFFFFYLFVVPNESHETLIKNASTSINISPIVSQWLHIFTIPLGSLFFFSSHFIKQYFT